MFESRDRPECVARTGHFVFRVWRKEDAAWSWRLQVEAVGSGACGVFESMQDALWFMREHMAVEGDAEGEVLEPLFSPEWSGCWLDDLGDSAEPVG